MGVEFMPTIVAPKCFEAHQRFVSGGGPELARALKAALVLTAGRFNGPRTQWLVSDSDLLRGGVSVVDGLSRRQDVLIFHPVSVVFKVIDLLLQFLLQDFAEARFELGEGLDHFRGLVSADLFEQGLDPGSRFRGAATVEVMGYFPQVLVGMPEVQLLAGVRETVFGQVPDPEGAIGDHQHLLGLAQTALEGFAIELCGERLQTQTGCAPAARVLTSRMLSGSKTTKGPSTGASVILLPREGICLCRMRLDGSCRRGGKAIQPRCSSFSNSVRAAISLSWPAGLHQFHRRANSWLKRRRLQSGRAASK